MYNSFIKKAISLIFLSGCVMASNAQIEEHTVVLGKDVTYIEGQHFKQGSNKDPKGVELDLNNYYLRLGGKPVLPVMGEIHYSRYPKAEWEEALLQMKAAGINVIAFYDFWIHHEQEEGKFRFDDNLDVRYFIELCAKHGLKCIGRIGPWAHGEARNGGMPDWFVKKKMKGGFDRVTKNGSVEPEVGNWYKAIAKQFAGLYYKDGGPLIGIQVDNEMRSNGPNSDGYKYMAALKQMAVADGIDVPLYVVTGWPGPQVPEDDVLPLWGGYPDAPWTQNTKDLPPDNVYTFKADRRDKNIGNDVLTYQPGEVKMPVYRHPYLTVELGGGMQVTYHRRPTLLGGDLLALDYTRLGVGANMLGYYVFHGTQHPLSWDGTYSTQESKSTIYPYPNDYPLISYDFESPLTEWGFIRDYYHDFKLLHQFINSYGSNLAPMSAQIPADNPEKADNLTDLRYSVRSRGGAGYLFINDYVRHYDMANHPNTAINIKTETETIRIPEKGGINISNKVYGVMPFNYNMDGVLLKYATAQPTTILNNKDKVYCYYAMDGIKPEFKFEKKNIKTLKTTATVIQVGKYTFVSNLKPGKNCTLDIATNDGHSFKILLLSRDEARYSYVFDIKGTQTLVLTPKMAFYDDKRDVITMRSIDSAAFSFDSYPACGTKSVAVRPAGKAGIFTHYRVALPEWDAVEVPFKQVSDEAKFKAYCDSLKGITPVGPTYAIHYNATLPYKAYSLTLPAKMPEFVHDVLLQFDYRGNTAGLYAGGTIIADDYYAGTTMPYSLKRHEDLLGKQPFVLQITPLMENRKIHFEPGTDLDFAKTTHAELRKIKVQPVYQVSF
ncbi:beta-galactosidase [Mucilaginibacter sp. HMF5004]|uniref:beta-galactosidase n=1 Tax=Mucilaginibacter rivuli TaxID=2857527 RepID=UPI001C5F34AA|nr:beta-galactosidase [Mucilaginibacter rivuli]MBW4889267.1 beta-galactosidase [Mucilaginibacter rivuli]